MDSQMNELLDLVENTESNMDALCLLATNISVPKQIIANLKYTKQSLLECKQSLLEYANKNDDFVRNFDKPSETKHKLDNSYDDKQIKDELESLHEVKPCVSNNLIAGDLVGKPDERILTSENKNVLIHEEDTSNCSPKEEIVDIDDVDLEYINDTNENVSSDGDLEDDKIKYSGNKHRTFI